MASQLCGCLSPPYTTVGPCYWDKETQDNRLGYTFTFPLSEIHSQAIPAQLNKPHIEMSHWYKKKKLMWFLLLIQIWNIHCVNLVRLMLFYHFVLAEGWLITQHCHWNLSSAQLDSVWVWVEFYNISVELKWILTVTNLIILGCSGYTRYPHYNYLNRSRSNQVKVMNLNGNIHVVAYEFPEWLSCLKICPDD